MYVERRHVDALVPPRIVSNRITSLSILASLAVGVAQFGASVFLAQYFQVARGHTPTQAGLLMLPLIVGNMIGATGTGQYITRTGRWKGIMMVGAALLVAGLCLMGTIDHLTPMWHLSAYMVLMGLGTGALMQNLVLVVQNTVDVTDVGAASGTVSFFRSLGGTVGVAALGAVLASRVADKISDRTRQCRAPPLGQRIRVPGSREPAAGGGHDRADGVRRCDGSDLPDRGADRHRHVRRGLADAGHRAAHHDPQGRGAGGEPARTPRLTLTVAQERKPTCPLTLVEMST